MPGHLDKGVERSSKSSKIIRRCIVENNKSFIPDISNALIMYTWYK